MAAAVFALADRGRRTGRQWRGITTARRGLRDASPAEIKRAYRKLARELHPDVNQDADAQHPVQGRHRGYEVLSTEEAQIVDLGGDPLGSAGGGNGGMRDRFAGSGSATSVDAFFVRPVAVPVAAGATQPGQPGLDALIRLTLTLEECGPPAQPRTDRGHGHPVRTVRRRGQPGRAPPPGRATRAVDAARSSPCSGPSSARLSPPGRARCVVASARSSPTRAPAVTARAGSGPGARSRGRCGRRGRRCPGSARRSG